jgi:murein DD-endopeptidase MepM/ murein hydrolase activator NlpD
MASHAARVSPARWLDEQKAASGGGPNGVVYPFLIPGQAAGPDGWTQDQGVDIGAPCGTTLVAMAPGQIIGQGISGFGPFAPELLVTAGPLAGRTIYYGHVQADLAPLGTQVSAGQPVAQIGDLGISFGCHLEIGISPPGAPPGTIPADHQTSQEMWDLLHTSLLRPVSGS